MFSIGRRFWIVLFAFQMISISLWLTNWTGFIRNRVLIRARTIQNETFLCAIQSHRSAIIWGGHQWSTRLSRDLPFPHFNPISTPLNSHFRHRDSGLGKTSLAKKYCHGQIRMDLKSTVRPIDRATSIQLGSVSGEERRHSLRPICNRTMWAVFAVFDLIWPETDYCSRIGFDHSESILIRIQSWFSCRDALWRIEYR
jgi:hypothetical protein